MKDLRKLFICGWLLVAFATIALLAVLAGVIRGASLGAALTVLLLLAVPAALVGLGMLGYRWFIISKRTGRRL